MPILLVLAVAASQANTPAEAVRLPDPAALTAQIAARDSEFFGLFFEGFDPARLRTMMADDIEM